jgi:hypothetical protein
MQFFNPIVLSSLLVAGCLTIMPSPARANQLSAEPSLTVTDQPAVIESEMSVKWEPIARINQAKPVTITLHNKTAEPLEYLITTHTDFRTIAPGATVSIQITEFPSFVNINAQRSVGVKYGLKVNGNKIDIDLNLTDGQGDTTLNIHELGAVYLY